jgi:hypothetical protein
MPQEGSAAEAQAQTRIEETRFQPSSKKNHPSQVHPEENARVVLEAFPVEQRVHDVEVGGGLVRHLQGIWVGGDPRQGGGPAR